MKPMTLDVLIGQLLEYRALGYGSNPVVVSGTFSRTTTVCNVDSDEDESDDDLRALSGQTSIILNVGPCN